MKDTKNRVTLSDNPVGFEKNECFSYKWAALSVIYLVNLFNYFYVTYGENSSVVH